LIVINNKMTRGQKRNSSREKKKENKKYPYKNRGKKE